LCLFVLFVIVLGGCDVLFSLNVFFFLLC